MKELFGQPEMSQPCLPIGMKTPRALGLDCGPMSGVKLDGVNTEFFAGTTWEANFICNIGHGTDEHLHPRAPRLDFDEACRVL